VLKCICISKNLLKLNFLKELYHLEKLYYEALYQREFSAEIINILEKDGKYLIELDKEGFYPGGEGQPCDSGYINDAPVLGVYEENGTVYHVVEIKPIKIHRVKCSIDWIKKYDYMQQHLGQHILSSLLLELYNAMTLKYQFEQTSSYIDIDKVISNEDLINIEQKANDIIHDNISVEILYPSNSELKKLLNRKIPQQQVNKVRLARIGDIEVSPCYGLLPNSTIEVQILKIIKITKQKNHTRIEFISGSRAVKNYIYTYESMGNLSKLLHCSTNCLTSEVEGLSSRLNKAQSEARELAAAVAQYEVQNILNSCETIKKVKVIKSIYTNNDLKYVSLLASKLTAFPDVIVLFGIKLQEMTHLMFMCSKDLKIISMNSLLKDAITLIDGKGGGSDFSAQGAGKQGHNLNSSLDYAYSKIKESILKN
jgi:alanyl-tRNA synthetase